MVTNAETPETPAGRGERIAQEAESVARTVIAGHPAGAVRRIVLYLIVGGAVYPAWGPTEHFIAALVGGMALILLAVTDQLA